MANVKLQVEGLKQFRKELKRLGNEMPKELQQTNKEVVTRIVVPEAQRRGRKTRTNLAGNPTHLGSRGVGTIRALASQTRAQIAIGSARVPWAMGHVWGSTGQYRQFPPARDGGYIIYPAIKEKRSEVIEAYGDAMEVLSRRAFPD